MIDRQEIFNEINKERDYQDNKWGALDSYGGHEMLAWLTIIRHLLSEAEDNWMSGKRGVSKRKILRIAATATAAIEQHGEVFRR